MNAELLSVLTKISYLVASVMFIYGLKGLTHPRTAVRGNLIGALGMLIAVVVTLVDKDIIGFQVIFAGLVVGTIIGTIIAVKIEMTAIPEMVALFNGLGGGASLLIAVWALEHYHDDPQALTLLFLLASVASALIGGVTFWGSIVAFGKLKGLIPGKQIIFPGQKVLNGLLAIAIIILTVYLSMNPTMLPAFFAICIISSLLGVLLVIPIGGADMPVVMSLLNSYSGLAAAATGFVLDNNVLIIAGSLVGASGLILTQIMCVAMNRSLVNVLFGKLGPTADGPSEDEVYAGKIKATNADEVAMLLDGVQRVAIVPGYGMAVSQAQHAVYDLAKILESRGTEVIFGIHPVAGRMPGHMNVLLAEANVPYDKLLEMDDINPLMKQIDVVIVIGANDVVNPDARTNPDSPIAGMPIIDVDYAHTVIVIKRSLSPGFAGIPNPLFAADNCLMFFGDGEKAFLEMITAVKES